MKPCSIFSPVMSLCNKVCIVSVHVFVLLCVCAGMSVFSSSRLGVINVSVCVLKHKCGACVCIHACNELIPSVCVLKHTLY